MHQTQENYNITRYIDKPLPHELLEDEVFRLKGFTLCPGVGARWVAQYEPELLRKEVIDRAWCGGKNQWVREHYRPLLERYGLIKPLAPRKQASAIQTDIVDIEARMAEADAINADIDALMAELDAIESSASTVESTPAVIESTPAPENNQDKKAESSLISVESLTPDIAPAFRGYPRLSKPTGRTYSAIEDEILIAQQVADLRWLYRRGHHIEIDTDACDGRARRLLVAEKFDEDLARKMAADRRLSGDKFVALLHLPAWLEVELVQLRSTRSKQVARDIAREKAAIEARFLRSVAMSNRPEQARHVPQWLIIWECVRLVGDSPTAIGRLHEAMTGIPMDKSRARALRDEVKKRLAGAMPKSS